MRYYRKGKVEQGAMGLWTILARARKIGVAYAWGAESGDVTALTIDIRTHKDFGGMFAASWPRAPDLLNALYEDEQ